MSRRAGLAIAAVLIAVAVARVASTWSIFSQTHDEPTHIAAGYQWLASGVYELDAEHPPLARVLFALQPFLDGACVDPATVDRNAQGNEILERDGRYRRNLIGARLGNVPFLVLALIIVALWARRLVGINGAILALALFSALPPILGHAGLATTDMAAAATTVAALFSFARWIEQPTWARAALTGVAIGIGLLSKFSFVIFFPVGAVAIALAQWKRPRARQTVAIAAVATVLVWGGYRFAIGTINDARLIVFPEGFEEHTAAKYARVPGYAWVRPDLVQRYARYAHDVERRTGFRGIDFVDWAKAAGYPSPLARRWGRDTMANQPPLPSRGFADTCLEPLRAARQWIGVFVPLPAPMFFAGIDYVARHSRTGHPAFLLGRYSPNGWWYYFPVILFFKTPLPFFLLSMMGLWFLARRPGEARGVAIAPMVMLLAAMTSGINIGVRHILPIYPLLAIAAAVAAMELWRRSRVVVLVLLGWSFIGTTAAHPDYLAWFNETAGRHPERITADSNLDWGQDLLRLEEVARDEKIDRLYLGYGGSADWKRHLPFAEPLPPNTPVTGWVALGEMQLIFERDSYTWLDAHRSYRRVGKSIRLYHIGE